MEREVLEVPLLVPTAEEDRGMVFLKREIRMARDPHGKAREVEVPEDKHEGLVVGAVGELGGIRTLRTGGEVRGLMFQKGLNTHELFLIWRACVRRKGRCVASESRTSNF